MKAMILAAGRGERMRPLTDRLPKPLLAVRGESLIERHLHRLAAAGFREIVVNTGWLGGQLHERLGDGRDYGVDLAWSDEGWPALETGGGVHRALALLGDGPFLALSADIRTDYPLEALRHRAASLRADDLAHLVMVTNPAWHPRGDFSLDAGRVRNAPRTLTFANLSILRPELFRGCADGAFPIGGLWQEAAAQDRVSGEHYAGPWWNLGTPAQLQELETHLATMDRRPSGVTHHE